MSGTASPRPNVHAQAARPASLADILAGESTVASAGAQTLRVVSEKGPASGPAVHGGAAGTRPDAGFQVGVADYFTLPEPSGPPRFTEGRDRLIGRAQPAGDCTVCGGALLYRDPPPTGSGAWEGWSHADPAKEHFRPVGWVK